MKRSLGAVWSMTFGCMSHKLCLNAGRTPPIPPHPAMPALSYPTWICSAGAAQPWYTQIKLTGMCVYDGSGCLVENGAVVH